VPYISDARRRIFADGVICRLLFVFILFVPKLLKANWINTVSLEFNVEIRRFLGDFWVWYGAGVTEHIFVHAVI